MKLTSLSKSTRAIGVMVLLSAIVIPNITATAQAQTPDDSLARQKACDRVFNENTEEIDGGRFFDDYKGLTLTDAQKKAEQALDKQGEAKRAEIMKKIISVPESLTFAPLQGISIPLDVQSAIDNINNSRPKVDQEAALNKRFGDGRYGFFIVGSYLNYLTQEQQTQIDKIGRNYYTQLQKIMTPAQLPQYRKNLAIRLKINAVCDAKWPISGSALGKIRSKAPTTK